MDFKVLFEQMKFEAAEREKRERLAQAEVDQRVLELCKGIQDFIQGSMVGPEVRREGINAIVTNGSETLTISVLTPMAFRVLAPSKGKVVNKGEEMDTVQMMRAVITFLRPELAE